MTKAELRKIYLGKRRDLSPSIRTAASKRIADIFFDSFDLAEIGFLHVYLPIEKFFEVDTLPIIERLWDEYPEVRTVVPRVREADGRMEGILYDRGTETGLSRWGIREPAGGETVKDAAIDLVLVPGVAFDAKFHRVGYGKGFYDRFLECCRPECVKVGLTFFDPVDIIDDAGAHDVRLDLLITPERLLGPVLL